MNTTFSTIFLIVLATVSLSAQTEPKRQSMDHQNHMQMMQMLKDSSMMDMMMSHIAADRRLRIAMMEKMAEYTEGDKEAMYELCTVMMKEKTATAGEKQMGCGMMMHDATKESNTSKDKNKQEDAHQQHKH